MHSPITPHSVRFTPLDTWLFRRIPARVQTTLPNDRDYVFEGRHFHASFYSYLVDANFACVQAVKDTGDPVALRRRDRIGTLYEADIPMVCAVEPEAAELGRSPTDTDIDSNACLPDKGLRYTQDNGIQLTNSITLWAGSQPSQAQ
ncbi:unnamed protein product [Penicillium glandicola]